MDTDTTHLPAQAADRLDTILEENRASGLAGVYCVCSAHPLVIEAALRLARRRGQVAVIEATCNQVNQEGGYTGMQPHDFTALVRAAARSAGLSPDRLVLGGDHLGPQPWRGETAESAMRKAEEMVAAYVRAGFTKIHLDCSMRCAGDPDPLPETVIAARAARLALAAEAAAGATGTQLRYIIGTEVPPPGGMGAGHAIVPTDPGHVRNTWETHREAFEAAGLSQAFACVVGIVVQPGLDFGNEDVVHFATTGATALSTALADLNGAVYEAHSTDYQRPAAYKALVKAHFAILKVGPAATFALREALYGLEAIEGELAPQIPSRLRETLESAMLAEPGDWTGHYSEGNLAYLRHFSFSDRIRYYWTRPDVQAALARLFANLAANPLPLPLISQYLPQHAAAIAEGTLAADAADLVMANVERALTPYADACGTHFPEPQGAEPWRP